MCVRGGCEGGCARECVYLCEGVRVRVCEGVCVCLSKKQTLQ